MADPDPMTCDPGSPVYDPDPGTVIPDPIYLVTTLQNSLIVTPLRHASRKQTRILLCKLNTKPRAFKMAADVYNLEKHFIPFSSSLF